MRPIARFVLAGALFFGLVVGAAAAPAASPLVLAAVSGNASPVSRTTASAQLLAARLGAADTGRTGSQESTTSVIVGYRRGEAARVKRAALALGCTVTRQAKGAGFWLVRVPGGVDVSSTVRALGKQPGVRYAEKNGIVHATMTSNDPLFNQEWGTLLIHAPSAWDVTRGSSVKVAVIDTGIDLDHPDLSGRIDAADGYDFVNRDSVPDDDEGHGTHVAGTIAATLNNKLGIAGVANQSMVIPIKALGADGSGTDADVAQGITWAADHGASVINLSLGSPDYSAAIDMAVQYATGKDCLVVAAAGNDGLNAVSYPAALGPDVIGVGSVGAGEAHSSFSNHGPEVDVCAPGENVSSTYLNGTYATASGTSMATPHVAAVAALVRALHPDWSRSEVEQRLESTAHDLGTSGRDEYYGFGRVDARAAVNRAPATGADTYTIPEDTTLTLTAGTSSSPLANDADADGDALTLATVVTQPVHASYWRLAADGSGSYRPSANFSGTDTIVYRAFDGYEYSASTTVTIVVTPVNDAPVAVNDSVTTDQDTPVEIRPLANDSDVDGDALSITSVGTSADGTMTILDSSTARFTPAVGFSGTTSFSYTVADGHGGTASATVTVVVRHYNTVPSAVSDTYDMFEDGVLSSSAPGVLGNDSDAQGDRMTAVVVNGPSYAADWALGADGALTYRPSKDFNGADTVVYRVFDGYGYSGSATVTIRVAPVNDAPLAVPDSATTSQSVPADIQPLANDGDVDGDVLSVASVGTSADGTVAKVDATTVRFTPSPGFSGTTSFDYVVSDGNGGTASATVTVRVLAPQAAAPDEPAPIPASAPTSITIGAVPSVVSYGTTITIGGVVRSGGVAVPGLRVVLRVSADGSVYTTSSAEATSDANGAFVLSHRSDQVSWYEVAFAGASGLEATVSVPSKVSSRACLGRPNALSRMDHTKYYTIYGTLRPAHKGSSVRIYRYRYYRGSWRRYGTYVKAYAYSSLVSKYRVRLRLPYAGRWRIRAYHADAGHAATYSSYEYVTVR